MTPLAAFPREGDAFLGRTLRVEALAHGVKRLVLTRPQVCNAFDASMIRELSLAMAELAAIQDPARMRLLLVEGEGSVFCSGADLAYMKEQGAAVQEQNLENARELGRMFTRLASFPAPVVCCVRGAAIGGGLGLTVCSDFVLAEPSALFATSEVMLGLVPSVIGPFVVRKLGLAAAGPLMLTGRRVHGAEALEAGLVQRLIDPSETHEEALTRVLREFLAAGPRAARSTKELLRRIAPLPDPELFEFTAHTIAAARMSAEGQEGLQAYFRKTPPPLEALMRRLVIANRGEIARRILRAGRARGWEVAVVSTSGDAGSPVRREADAVLEVEGFLDGAAIVEAALGWGAHLLHPGYGYLSENAAFARAVEKAGIRFVGPTPENMVALGGKESAKAVARACGVPVLEALLSQELAALPAPAWPEALAGRGILPPYLVKASGGGGGRGMRVVEAAADLPDAVERASREALASFGDGTVFVERLLRSPRHLEAQVFGDGHGGGVFLGERECSLQRRHQKVLEEAPSPAADPALREALGRAALALVRRTAYRGAGTVEFLLDGEGAFHFLEMNTRLQVEHPVTELAYGVDLVLAQLDLAEGAWPASLGDPAVFALPEPRGVALEARVLAEDPRNGFLPTPGPLKVYVEPAGPGVRVDSGVAQGGFVNAGFDSMIAKLVVWGPDRAAAVARLAEALEDFTVLGCTTNLPFLQAVARSEDYLAGREATDWIQGNLERLNAPLMPAPWLAFFRSPAFREALAMAFRGAGAPGPGPAGRFKAQAGNPELRTGSALEKDIFHLEGGPDLFTLRGPILRRLLDAPARPGERGPGLARALAAAGEADPALPLRACRLGGAAMAVAVFGETLRLEDPCADLAPGPERAADGGEVAAPMAGRILECLVAKGEAVEQGQLMFVLESMKMQFEITAPRAGTVAEVCVEPGQVLQGPGTVAVLA